MKSGQKILQAIGAVGLLSMLIVGGYSGIVLADDVIEKQAAAIAQPQPPPALLPVVPDSTANPEGVKSNSGKQDKSADDKRTPRAKLLTMFLMLLERHRAGVP